MRRIVLVASLAFSAPAQDGCATGRVITLGPASAWTHVNPDTRFPNIDGGFCCDQRTLYVPSHDITFWVLLYLPKLVVSNSLGLRVGGLR